MASYDDAASGQDVAARDSAQSLQQAQTACAEALYYLDAMTTGDPEKAILSTTMPENSPMPEVHASLLRYYRQMKPHLITKAEGHHTGEYYKQEGEAPLATIEVPTGPAVDGYQQTEPVDIVGFRDLDDWSMRSVRVPGGRGEPQKARAYLSPAAVQTCYSKLLYVQSRLGLHVRARDEISQSTGQQNVSRI